MRQVVCSVSSSQPQYCTYAANKAKAEGKRAIHWSVRADPHLPLNFTHEYQNVFLETSTYDAHQFTMKTGTPYDNATMGEVPATRTLRIESSTKGGVAEKTLFETEYTVGDWYVLRVPVLGGPLTV